MHFRKIIFLLLNPLIISTLTAQNPLSVTGNFTVFAEQNTSIMGGDVEGGIATGGNFIINGTSNLVDNFSGSGNIYGTIGGNNYVLVVGGQIVYTSGTSTIAVNGNVNRNIKINNLGGGTTTQSGSNISIQNGGTSIQINSTPQSTSNIVGTTGLDFAATFTYLRALSTGFSTCSNTIIPTYDIGSTNPKISIVPNTRNVWNISSADLNSWTTIVFNNSNALNPNTPLIINVNATSTFNWNTVNMSGISRTTGAQYILWNFYNTTTLNIQGSSTVEGSILAPNATINKTSSANIEGQVIAVNYNQIVASEVHVAHFNVNANVAHCCSNTTSAGAIGSNQSGCGTSFDPSVLTETSVPVGGLGTLQYQWQTSTDNINWTNVSGATGQIFDPSSITTTTYYRRGVRRQDCTTYIYSNSISVTINPIISISTQPSALVECIGGTQTMSVAAIGGFAPLTYQWQNGGTTGAFWTNIAGATATTYLPLSTAAGTTLYRVIVSSSSGAGCNAVTSSNATVTVVNDPIVSITTPTTTVCTGANITFSANLTGGTGVCTIQWQSSPNGITWNNISGAVGNTLNIANLNTTTRYRVQLLSCTGSGCCN